MGSLRDRLIEAERRAAAARGLAPTDAGLCVHLAGRTRTGCCSGRLYVRCDHPTRRGLAVGADACGPACPDYAPRRPLTISAVVTAFNEGPEVARTLESLSRAVGPAARLEIVLVDDASTDGSCGPARLEPLVREASAGRAVLKVLRHDEPQGVGRSRNAGWRASTGEVVAFFDAHMRFPPADGDEAFFPGVGPRALEALALKALAEEAEGGRGAFVCAGSAGLKVEDGRDRPAGCRLFCCDLFYNARDGLQPKWLYVGRQPPRPWERSPAPMGAGYLLGRRTAERLEAATGSLWDDTAGRWGFSEQAMAVKCFLLDVPVLFSGRIYLRHLYRSTNPVPDAARQVRRNICRATAALFGPQVWERRFRPLCERWLRPEEMADLCREGFEAGPRPWTRDPEDVFTHLCGKRAPVVRPHPDHAWLVQVEAACRALARRSPEGRGVRVLQWRPGEATVLVRRLLPEAHLFCIETPGHRADNWTPIARALGAKVLAVPLGPDYPEAARRWGGRFDMVLVGGEMQQACKAVAGDLLAPGGLIIVNPAADRNQIEDAELRKEKQSIEKALQGTPDRERPAGPAAGSTSSPIARRGRPLVTCVLLNWRRPQNLPRVLECLKGQTVPVQVFLWDNSGGSPPVPDDPIVALRVTSSQNLGCFPRWALAAMADTPFVCSIDDDLVLADERVLADALAALERRPDSIVGFFGWQHVEGRPYRAARHINGSTQDRPVDVIKGRFMVLRRALLSRVPLAPPDLGPEDLEAVRGEDDIYVSLCAAGGRWGRHLVPGALGRRWRELPQHGAARAARPDHYAMRDRAVKALRQWLLKGRGG